MTASFTSTALLATASFTSTALSTTASLASAILFDVVSFASVVAFLTSAEASFAASLTCVATPDIASFVASTFCCASSLSKQHVTTKPTPNTNATANTDFFIIILQFMVTFLRLQIDLLF